MAKKKDTGAKGQILQVLGAVVDVQFSEGEVPAILNALHTDNNGQTLVLLSLKKAGLFTVKRLRLPSKRQKQSSL